MKTQSKTKTKAKAIRLEIVPAETPQGKLAAVIGTAAEVAKSIADDCKFVTGYARVSAFVALRVGLRLALLRDTEAYGSLSKFIKDHLKQHGHSERTLYNYLRIAGQFVADVNLADRKTQRLTDGEKIAPCLAADIQALSNGKAEGVAKKMIQWVNGRTVSQIYRDLAEEMPKATPKGGKRTAADDEPDDVALAVEEAKADFLRLGEFRVLARWQFLDSDELAKLADELSEFIKVVGEFQKQAKGGERRAESKSAAKWKGVKS